MYDIIYIGGGLNYAGAIVASKAGKKVALIERDLNQLGGACLHKGCIPSKMFLHYSELIFESRNAIVDGELKLNMHTLLEKKTKLLKSAAQAVSKQCSHFDMFEADARVIAPYKVLVGDKTLEASHIVIGTGSHPFIPQGIDDDGRSIITSDEVLMLDSLPEEITIYGDGAIGLEMASFFATAGSKVTLIYRHETIQEKAHALIQTALADQLDFLGVKRLNNHAIKTACKTTDGVTISFESGEVLKTSILLVAAGRSPHKEVVACDEIKVSKGIETNEWFETSLKDHYAIGDCNAKVQLAHAARAQVLNVTAQILGDKPKELNLEHLVKFIHTLPMSYATVGKSQKALEKAGISYKQSMVTLNQFTYSAYNHAGKGLMITFANDAGLVLGAEIFAPNAEELISSVAMALAGEMDTHHAKSTILAHPSFSEALERTFYKL